MKLKTTKKNILANFPVVVKVGYCTLQNLLNEQNPIAYASGVYGWNADIYDLGGGIAVSTGYRPFGNKQIDYSVLSDLERRSYDKNENKQYLIEELKRLARA